MADAHDSDAMQIDEASMHFESLPSELRLCCCEFLDAGSLARLELCARESLGSTDETKRAWKQLAAGSSRGDLVDCSDKQLAVVTAGVRALFPRGMMAHSDGLDDVPLPPPPEHCLGDFVFTWFICWQGENSPFQTAAFEHLACHSTYDRETPRVIAEHNVSEYVFNVPADAHKAHAAISPFLKSSQDVVDIDDANAFFRDWSPSAILICTRKRDGKSIKLALFDDLTHEINSMVSNDDPYGSLMFEHDYLKLPHVTDHLREQGYDHDTVEFFEEIRCATTLYFCKDTGRLRYIFSSFHDANVDSVPYEYIRMLLHAQCDAA